MRERIDYNYETCRKEGYIVSGERVEITIFLEEVVRDEIENSSSMTGEIFCSPSMTQF